ncbi:cytochrome P450 [Streptomyces sp. NPDC093252]|uniref:cytochrome P450 n=1 Tax=Streptomyces sp. NPDC093252 TaxID=3154980 RepID=UPI00343FD6BE
MTISPEGCPVRHDFDPLEAGFTADPFTQLADLRAQSPVCYAPAIKMWVVTRYRDVERILKDHERFSGANTQQPVFPLSEEAAAVMADGFGATPTLSNGPEPRHGRVRAHCLKAFSARRLAVLAPTIRTRAAELIDAMLTRDRFEVVSSLTYPLPASVVFALIGFPPRDAIRLKGLAAERMLFTWGRPSEAQQLDVARFMVDYWAYCEDFVARRLEDPDDSFTGDLVRIHRDDPDALTPDEIVNVIHAISFAGHETTTNVATSALLRLLRHRDQWEAICAHPELIPGAVEEALRYDPSLFTWRRVTTTAVDIDGVRLPAGTPLLLAIGSANHDERKFPGPDAFDIRRPGNQQHLTFGKGGHYCFGAPLARMELRALLELLSARAPSLRLAPGQDITFHTNVVFHGPRELVLEWDGPVTA